MGDFERLFLKNIDDVSISFKVCPVMFLESTPEKYLGILNVKGCLQEFPKKSFMNFKEFYSDFQDLLLIFIFIKEIFNPRLAHFKTHNYITFLFSLWAVEFNTRLTILFLELSTKLVFCKFIQ